MRDDDFAEQAAKITPGNCISKVKGHWDVYEHQCSRKGGYGYKKLYCKQHAGLTKKRVYKD
jgi:hypothetical protein